MEIAVDTRIYDLVTCAQTLTLFMRVALGKLCPIMHKNTPPPNSISIVCTSAPRHKPFFCCCGPFPLCLEPCFLGCCCFRCCHGTDATRIALAYLRHVYLLPTAESVADQCEILNQLSMKQSDTQPLVRLPPAVFDPLLRSRNFRGNGPQTNDDG